MPWFICGFLVRCFLPLWHHWHEKFLYRKEVVWRYLWSLFAIFCLVCDFGGVVRGGYWIIKWHDIFCSFFFFTILFCWNGLWFQFFIDSVLWWLAVDVFSIFLNVIFFSFLLISHLLLALTVSQWVTYLASWLLWVVVDDFYSSMIYFCFKFLSFMSLEMVCFFSI